MEGLATSFVFGAADRFFLCVTHGTPSLLVFHRSMRSLHICHPLQCMRGYSKTPFHFVPVGLKLRAFCSGPSISKLSRFPNRALWLPWVTQKGTYAGQPRSTFLLDRYFPIVAPSPVDQRTSWTGTSCLDPGIQVSCGEYQP